MMVAPLSSIHRVVSCFILKAAGAAGADAGAARQGDRDPLLLRIAVFHRVATMPTFPGHWAAISGSIEAGETPWETCRRELTEETNVNSELARQPDRQQSGLYVDVPLATENNNSNVNENKNNSKDQHNDDEDQYVPPPPQSQRHLQRTIRVYPFTVEIPASWDLQLRGTEHDRFEWITVDELELLEPAVPALATAFHHATAGRYLTSVTPSEREWADDRVSGAATMARRAVELSILEQADPSRMITMRPSMVAITNALQPIIQGQMRARDGLESLDKATEESIDYAVSNILSLCRDLRRRRQEQQLQEQGQRQRPRPRPLRIATHSRSSTLLAVLQRVLMASDEYEDEDEYDEDEMDDTDSSNNNDKIDTIPLIQRPILCGQSTPGNEGELLARDLNNLVASPLFGSVSSSTVTAGTGTTAGAETTIPAEAAICVDDDTLYDLMAMVRNSAGVDLLLVGADCICQDAIVNKVGTKRLAQAAVAVAAAAAAQPTTCTSNGSTSSSSSSRCHVVCCADRFKLWDDVFPPPLEDMFESVPITLFDRVLVPPPPPPPSAMEKWQPSSQL